MSELKNVQQIENAVQASIEVETAIGSKYSFSLPDTWGYRHITKLTMSGEIIELRGKIFGIAVEDPPKKIGALLQDDRWAIASEVVNIGQYMVILGDDAQFTITGRITSLKTG